jgi:hypothetical protein
MTTPTADQQRIRVYQGSQLIFENITWFPSVHDRIITSEWISVTIFDDNLYPSVRDTVTVTENIAFSII